MQINLQWYVLRSKPNKEMTLAQQLNVYGFESFSPQLRVRPVNPRSRRVRPYFPGYLFVHTNVDQVGASIFRWMPFSNGFVSFGDVLATVPNSLIQAIRRHVEEINAAGVEQLAGLKHGDEVLIQGGPLDGYRAIFDTRLPGRERVRVLLKLLQTRQMSVELPAARIERPHAPLRGKSR
jgi:transcriptional antiterminator RfaH